MNKSILLILVWMSACLGGLRAGDRPVWQFGGKTDVEPQMTLTHGEVRDTDEHGVGIEFRGYGSRAHIPDLPNITSKEGVTISLLFWCDDLPYSTKADGSLEAWALLSCDYSVLLRVYSNGTVYGGLQDVDGQLHGIFSIDTITVGEWHHLAMTYSHKDNIMRLYLDGKIVGSTIEDLGEFASLPPSTVLVLGSDPDGSDFVGTIADVKIYNYALSPSEVENAPSLTP